MYYVSKRIFIREHNRIAAFHQNSVVDEIIDKTAKTLMSSVGFEDLKKPLK
jgi:hypothetical protein